LLLSGGIARAMRHVKPAFHDRVVWLLSPDASRLLLLAGASAVMALSPVMAASRSGIAAMFFALALTGVVAMRRQVGTTRRTVVTGYVVLLAVAVTGWVGTDTIVSRFARMDWSIDRRGPWSDAAAVASTYPLTGTGLNTYGGTLLFYQRHDLELYYRTAHDDYLQLAADRIERPTGRTPRPAGRRTLQVCGSRAPAVSLRTYRYVVVFIQTENYMAKAVVRRRKRAAAGVVTHSRGRAGWVRKNVAMDQGKLDAARRALGVSTETETIDQALDFVAFHEELAKGIAAVRRSGGVDDVFEDRRRT